MVLRKISIFLESTETLVEDGTWVVTSMSNDCQLLSEVGGTHSVGVFVPSIFLKLDFASNLDGELTI